MTQVDGNYWRLPCSLRCLMAPFIMISEQCAWSSFMSSESFQRIYSFIDQLFVSAFSNSCLGFCLLFVMAFWLFHITWLCLESRPHLRYFLASGLSSGLDLLVLHAFGEILAAAETIYVICCSYSDKLYGISPPSQVTPSPSYLLLHVRISTSGGHLLQTQNFNWFYNRCHSTCGFCPLMLLISPSSQNWALKRQHPIVTDSDRRAHSSLWEAIHHTLFFHRSCQHFSSTEIVEFYIAYQGSKALCSCWLISWGLQFALSLLLCSDRILNFVIRKLKSARVLIGFHILWRLHHIFGGFRRVHMGSLAQSGHIFLVLCLVLHFSADQEFWCLGSALVRSRLFTWVVFSDCHIVRLLVFWPQRFHTPLDQFLICVDLTSYLSFWYFHIGFRYSNWLSLYHREPIAAHRYDGLGSVTSVHQMKPNSALLRLRRLLSSWWWSLLLALSWALLRSFVTMLLFCSLWCLWIPGTCPYSYSSSQILRSISLLLSDW